ncbi:MAG: hypothetical protein JWO86_2963 [Myxococcaceae bacterium]|jgi:uncharacterized protein YndB with AHSA1/START domain|nr:hypothetical protein [Myxococcaceae bacterium]
MNMPSTTSSPKNTDGDDLLVRKNVFVKASPQRAFDVFTKEMASWWPLASHHVGKVDAKTMVIEPRVGGDIKEVGIDDSTCTWGHVLAWDPPGHFAFTWELDAAFQIDPTMNTRVEVTFTAEKGGTSVDLVHRGLRAYGEKAGEMIAIFDSPGGWTGLLAAFATQASAA